MKNLYNIESAKRVLQSEWKRNGIPFYRAREIVKLANTDRVDNELFISDEHYESLAASFGVPQKTDIMLSAVGSIGKTYIVKEMDIFYYKDASVLCLKNDYSLNSEFVQDLLCSDFCQKQMYNHSKGTTVDTITIEKANEYFMPLPPLAEQQRIVESIEQAFALIDEIDSNKADLSKAIKQAKAKVLDLAIRGKLVPQDPNDEPASVLLERIKAEKQNSAKTSKKAPKPTSTTSDNSHYPFDIPESWVWCRGISIMNQMLSTKPSGDTFRYLDIESINNHNHIIENPKYIKSSEAPSRASRLIQYGDTLFSMVRPYLENIAFVDEQFTDCIASTGFYVCSPNETIKPKYLFNLMTSQYVIRGLNSYMKGDNSPSINNDNILHYNFPLPPLAEQQRIVAKIEEIFKQLDNIEVSLKA